MYKRSPFKVICQKCGKLATTRSGATKYCRKCAHKVKLELHREDKRRRNYVKRKSLNLVCQVCGKNITDIKKRRRYCSDVCLRKVQREAVKKYHEQHREERLAYLKQYYQNPENKERHRDRALISFHKNAEVQYDI